MEGTVFGRYRLIELLGRGGMGEVWRAYDTAIDRVVALKMLLPHYAQDPDFEQRFRREARAAARLNDPHIVPIHDFGEIDGRLYVTMRLIEGVDLQVLLDAGPLEAERAVHIIEQIASALNDAHQVGLVHRDVKPSNILVAANDFAYLIDFGIARTVNETGLTSAGATIGTWSYMAPERFNSANIEPTSDVYALACVLYQCLTGELPFPGTTLEQVAVGHIVTPPPRPSEECATVPTELDEVIATGLAKLPAERYQTTVAMAAAARHAITGHGRQPDSHASVQPQRSATSSQPRQRTTPRHPSASPMAATVVPSFSAPPPPPPPGPPSIQKSSSRGHRILIGALAAAASVVIVVAAIAGVRLIIGHRSLTPAAPQATTARPVTEAATGSHFAGTYRAEFGPATDLDGKPIAGAQPTNNTWGVRSTCGSGGCIATASLIAGAGLILVSNFVFDELGGSWLAVALSSAQCNGAPTEIWVVMTLQPRPDGTLAGETTRSSADSGCVAKRTVNFTRTADSNLSTVPDPAALPPRAPSTAETLHGRYHETTTFTNGATAPGQDDLTVRTVCLRTGDRCISLFHAPDGVVTLIFGSGKWTRNEAGDAPCERGGTAHVALTAEYRLPEPLQDPIPLLTGHGSQHVSAGSACDAGGDFDDKFVRTGD